MLGRVLAIQQVLDTSWGLLDKIEWGKEIVQAGSDAAGLAKDVGIPGVGLLARFAQHFY